MPELVNLGALRITNLNVLKKSSMTTLICFSSMATRRLLQTLCDRWGEVSLQTVQLQSMGGVDAVKRIEAGERFDVAVLASDMLQKLVATGHVNAVTSIAASGVSIAATSGTAPTVASRDQLLAAMRSAKAIGYSTGPSGKALLNLLDRWGVLDDLHPRLIQAQPGVAVGELIAGGVVDLGFQQHSELIHYNNISLLGPMPVGYEITTVFAAATGTASNQAEKAADFIAYLSSAKSANVIRQEGMEPLTSPD